jgi:hypothetical protein
MVVWEDGGAQPRLLPDLTRRSRQRTQVPCLKQGGLLRFICQPGA